MINNEKNDICARYEPPILRLRKQQTTSNNNRG
jgi:hypothetical protein